MKTALTLTLISIALGIFSIWFFPLNGVTLAGLILGTGFYVVGSLFGFITYLIAKENF